MTESTSSEAPAPSSFWRAVAGVPLGHPGRVGSTVHGTLLVLTALTTAYAAERNHPWTLVVLVSSLVVVFWLNYVYAHALSESIESRTRLSRPTVIRIANRELGLILAAVAPVAALLLGALDVISEPASIWLAIGLGFTALFAQGFRYARATELGRAGTAAVLLINIVLGLFVVLVKVKFIH
jgi:hypothetical protein